MNKTQCKAFKNEMKKIMPVPWHPTRLWDWCMSEDEKKDTKPIFTDEKLIQISPILKW